MRQFWITIKGALESDVSDKLWEDIKNDNVNLTVLEHKGYIYGQKDNDTILKILSKVLELGCRVEVEVSPE